MKLARWFAGLLAVGYAAQIACAVFFELRPLDSRRHGTDLYVIRQGFGIPLSMVPILGAAGFSPEVAVRLTVYDALDKKKFERGFDMRGDVHEAYPEVWPEKKRAQPGNRQ